VFGRRPQGSVLDSSSADYCFNGLYILKGSVWVYFLVFHHSILCKGHIFAWTKICDPEFC